MTEEISDLILEFKKSGLTNPEISKRISEERNIILSRETIRKSLVGTGYEHR